MRRTFWFVLDSFGIGDSFADMGATIANLFGVEMDEGMPIR